MERAAYYRYWGKARPQADGSRFHLLPYHSLDVAASGVALLRQRDALWKDVASFLGLEPEALLSWFAFLLSIHDVGKFADGFQNLRPDLLEELQDRSVTVPYDDRHDTLGHRVSTGTAVNPGLLLALLEEETSEADPADLRDVLDPWLSAVTGHHGRPPRLCTNAHPISRQFPPNVRCDALEFVREMKVLLLPSGLPTGLFEYSNLLAFRRVSWITAGLAVAADWIGSNSAWFPYQPDVIPLAEYWAAHALPRADSAVRESGLVCAPPAECTGLRTLFPAIQSLTPLQALAEGLALSGGPQLVVIEEVTGGGKTEAAMALAHRLMANGSTDGFYIALPTMATANAMHDRLSPMYRRLFAEGSLPSWVLAHSASGMVLPLEERTRMGDPGPGSEPAASRQCSVWLADSRKKALLAHAGVGTIDQALLAVLAARHQSMRLFGLSRKVLVVDEVHACDAYMHRLLTSLLRFHAALGGSAILLSATLPSRMRTELVTAFANGLGVETSEPACDSYPLVTHLTYDGLTEHPVSARPSSSRRVAVRPLRSDDEVSHSLAATLASGGCACWVRNTVDDALDAYREWTSRLGADRVTLFHARFALVDRLRIEREVLRLFGPGSHGEDRAGRLLVATQVVEQSLDLDFDGMVTDLAPIDLVVQRAGRLKRHSRRADGTRTDGPDARTLPELGVAMPEPVADAERDWYSQRFPRGAWVYEHHGQLWLTARWLAANLAFAMPEEARTMIEAVYSEAPQGEVPEGLRARSQRAEGRHRADSALARLNSLDLDAGYTATASPWQDDVSAPTRLGEPTCTVRLARVEGGVLVPWADGDPRHAWQLSQLTVRRSRIAEEDPGLPQDLLDAARETMRDRGEHCAILPLSSSGEGWAGSAVDARGRLVRVRYDRHVGLQYGGGETDEPH